MTFDDILKEIDKIGLKKGTLEKKCGLCAGKMTELSKGRAAYTEEVLGKIQFGLEETVEELNLLLEQIQNFDFSKVGQYCVYEFTFPDGKKYYGHTVSPEARWKNGNNYKTQKVGEAIQEVGWDNVQKKILAENLTKETAQLIERTFIKATNSDVFLFGYNIY